MDPFLGEIRLFACTFVPQGWAACNGAVMAISQFSALYSLLGTQFGGDGRTTFALPNLSGAAALGQGQLTGGSNYPMGVTVGTTNVTLTLQQMPAHVHTMPAGSPGVPNTLPSPTSYLSAGPSTGIRQPAPPVYASPATQSSSAVTMAAAEAGVAGGSQPHSNQSPYLALQYCIAVQGLFPPRQ